MSVQLADQMKDQTFAIDRPFTSATNELIPRTTRKPSPGLAARLKALGFGVEKRNTVSPSKEQQIGRIPEDQIRHIDTLHQANSSQSFEIQRRGRAWSGASGRLTPQVTGGSFSSLPAGRLTPQYTGSSLGDYRLDSGRRRTISTTDSENSAMNALPAEEEMDSQKYRLPDHINGNGTKATPETKQAHIESAPPYIESQPPTPIEKDTPPVEQSSTNEMEANVCEQDATTNGQPEPEELPDEVQSFFNPLGLQRPGSIYTLSRVSFANQLAQLTSLSLPDADSLESHISGIPTAPVATTHLISIANSVRAWISRASELLAGLDADDDVEWAAAGGREGLEEVDGAVSRFEKLINVYVGAIDQLQKRADCADVSKSKMTTLVTQTESILSEWTQIRKKLRGVKEQVELAMEWEDIWNVVLGDIGNEMGALNRLVFEIEEKRHKTIVVESNGGIDPAELDTIDEEIPKISPRLTTSNRFLPTGFPASPKSPDMQPAMAEDDSSLMALSARLQPLHASLTFVPIRLSTYVPRAEKLFPTACQELETRRLGLERDWLRLKADADALQQELGEDKWIQVFRNANRSAERMVKSIEKAIAKVKESFEAGQHLTNPNGMAKKVDAYLKRKMHFGSAIEKVLIVIGNGLKDRLTVNGEISRMHQDTQTRWDALRERLYEVDKIIEELQIDEENGQLRDSMSTMGSLDTFSMVDSPNSSPASSVIEASARTPNSAPRGNKRSSLPRPGVPATRRSVSGPNGQAPSSQLRTPTSRLSSMGSSTFSQSQSSRQNSLTPTSSNRLPRPSLNPSSSDKPRWNSSVKTSDLPPVRSHTSMSYSTPTARNGASSSRSIRSVSHTPGSGMESKIPLRSPLSREASSSPMPPRNQTPSKSRESSFSSHRKVSFSEIKSTPGPYSQQVLNAGRPRLSHKASTPNLSTNTPPSLLRSSFSSSSKRHSVMPSIETPDSIHSSPNSPPSASPAMERRAFTSMGNRRQSLLPMPRGRQNSRDGSEAAASMAMKVRRASSIMSTGSGSGSTGSQGDKPRWRPV